MRVIVLTTLERRLRALDAVRAAEINAEHPLSVTISTYRHKRSLEQNARYWAILGDISEQCRPRDVQYDADTWHEYFAGRWLPKAEFYLPNGKTVLRRKSTKELSVQEFGAYMTRLEVWAVEHDVVLLEA